VFNESPIKINAYEMAQNFMKNQTLVNDAKIAHKIRVKTANHKSRPKTSMGTIRKQALASKGFSSYLEFI
jgi:hypothetical protein